MRKIGRPLAIVVGVIAVLATLGVLRGGSPRTSITTPAPAAQVSATALPPPTSTVPAATDTPPPTEPPAAEPTNTMTENLAVIDGVEGDAAAVTRIALLLVELDRLYPETEQEIGDLTAQAHSVLIDKGKPASMIEIMEAMVPLAGTAPGITYKDAIIGWMVVRTGG
jgi:hypothetical protein